MGFLLLIMIVNPRLICYDDFMQKKTYKIKAWGCAMNLSDSERIKAVMRAADFKENNIQPDVVILVACSIRQSAIDRLWWQIQINSQKPIDNRQGILKRPLIVLTGCVLETDKKKFEKLVDILIDIKKIEKLPVIINKKSEGVKIIKQLSNSATDYNYFHVSPVRDSKFSALVPIMTGCNNYCSYCAVPYTRGREYSRPAQKIIKEVENLVKNGYKEIILLGQNVNSYNGRLDSKSKIPDTKQIQNFKFKFQNDVITFSDLLRSLNALNGDFWIRFFTSHPKDLSDELIKTMKECDKVCKYINLPVQAGDNATLKKMNRKYSIQHYKKLIGKLRKSMPNIAISTDIIVGFPEETNKQFENSAKLFRDVKYDMAYIAQFSMRPGTAATKLKDNVRKEEKKHREKILTEILKKTAWQNNKKYIGKLAKILVEKKIKNGKYFGKTESYKHVMFNGKKNLIGKFIMVKISGMVSFGLKGKIINT